MRDWLERDQLGYWQSQIKKRQEDLMQARADLHRARSRSREATPSPTPSRRRRCGKPRSGCRVAEEKVAVIKRLIPFFHHAIDEYHSHSQPLGDHLAGGFEKSLFTLEKMIGSLEAYLALQAPTAPRLDSLPETGAVGDREPARPAQRDRRRLDGGRPPAAERRRQQHDREPDRHGRDRRAGR